MDPQFIKTEDFTISIDDLTTKCSFCFEEFQNEATIVKITEEIEEKFDELVRCEVCYPFLSNFSA
jgi:uncharacterized protein with PIN domain